MKKISRRSFVKTTAVTAASLSLFGLAGCKKTEQKPAATQDAAAPVVEGTKTEAPKTGHTVVIAGGGYGGATTAKYLKILNPAINVILVDRNAEHVSCAMSNEVIFGLRDMSEITMPLKRLADNHGIDFRQAEVTGLDKEKKVLKTSAGDISYDKLVVSPGISMDYDPALNFTEDKQAKYPHAWIAGKQTEQLRDMVSDDIIFISESGIKTREDIKTLQQHRVDGVLIGETMLKSRNKRHTLEVLKGIHQADED